MKLILFPLIMSSEQILPFRSEIFFDIRTILRATSMMITDTDNDQLNY